MGKILSIIAAIFIGIAAAEAPLGESNVLGPIDAEARIEPKITISLASPEGTIYFGDEVTLLCSVEGMDGLEYTIDWQYSADGNDFANLGCHDQKYTFVITRENVGYRYRVVISQ